ncbi:MAG: hypothetical protein KA766_12335 [Piscinibacter sp.]|uniref:WD40/YVTN/BNR-like repeat-containing protein n=1 Tax=Piscinibacter sp. TaxID=1903157 RepID=UPI001B65F26A|nr:hypothetical protein [Piscinibacter sp.]MBP5990784.1 hypothetical protein [Piscinibacter sp.]MBP6028194.1 hypothetical protein [Piscinibacter sp.]
MALARRAFILCAASAAAGVRAEPYAADGPARLRGGALHGVLLDVSAAGARLVAVGERGHVLLSDDQGRSWRQAQAVPTRTTLTCVHASDARSLWAAGHGGVILRSDDAGEHWSVAAGKADGADVLLAIRVEPGGRGLAVGGFGVAQQTSDGGQHWAPATLVDGEAGERHLNRIFVSASGAWLIAAEGGQVLRQGAAGERWQAVKTPYNGSLWGGVALGERLLACGMRGNLVISTDDGRSWSHQAVAEAGSFTAAVALPDGRAALVGVDGTLVLGDAGERRFQFHRLDDRATLTGAFALPSGPLALATMSGMRIVDPRQIGR